MAKSPKKGNGGGNKVGPGNPPKHTRFVKGKSGNPGGRPPGSKNLATLLKEAADGPVTATIDGKQRRISKLQATTMQLATSAASGKPASVAKFLDWIDEIERRAAAARPAQYPLEAADIEVLKYIYKRVNMCSVPTPGPTKR